MSPSTSFFVAMVPFLMLWVGVADSAPTFGLLSLLAGNTNSTSLLGSLVASHLQAKLTALAVLSDFLAFFANGTAIG